MHRLPRTFRLRQQQVPPRTINQFPQRRLQSQKVYKQNGEALRYQPVRFKKPGITYRRLITHGLYLGAIIGYGTILSRYITVEVEVLGDDGEEESQDAGAGEREDDEFVEEDSLFIPMTWAKKMPRTFYKGSDPEWQEFIKMAKDKQRQKKVQDELVQIVHGSSQKHPLISKQLGSGAKVGKYWLDISFPDGPPQEYERSGLEWGDGYLAWSRERISPEAQWRLARALWPKAAFDSLWAMTKVLAGINYRRAKQALGWEEADPFSPEERYRHAMEMMEKQQQSRERKEVGKAQLDPNGNPSAVVGASSSPAAQPSRSAADESKRIPWQIPVPMPATSSTNSTDLPIAMHVFQGTLAKQWNPSKIEPPRGTFVVQGLVEVRGARGRMLFDVKSFYDPKAGKYVSINAGVRNFKRWSQAPRGGP
ncbi:Hypothetical predicted protein [Lecanosticta acicola]|uniref:Uncharacterized protein n=1 Tax=Lecanosticta acicola TaxID=111012 RepID=A0AAI9EEF7_9PEZI|nr:Hypothetical predicted protein [Lecanosticta acicola]